jgi:hypothetical protein
VTVTVTARCHNIKLLYKNSPLKKSSSSFNLQLWILMVKSWLQFVLLDSEIWKEIILDFCVCVCVWAPDLFVIFTAGNSLSTPLHGKEGRCTALRTSYIKVFYSKCWTVEERREKTFSTGKFRYQFYMFSLELNPAQPSDVYVCVYMYIYIYIYIYIYTYTHTHTHITRVRRKNNLSPTTS